MAARAPTSTRPCTGVTTAGRDGCGGTGAAQPGNSGAEFLSATERATGALPPAPAAMPRYAFEDFVPGSVDLPGTLTVDRDEIIAFARAFDPQPFHIDEEAARHSFAGRLIASGWHSCAMLMRLLAEGFVLDSTSMGAPGVDEAKWLKPVYPGDVLRARRTVLETKSSRSRPEMGLVRFRFELLNQADEPVLEQLNWLMLGRRDAPAGMAPEVRGATAEAPAREASPPEPAASGQPQAPEPADSSPPYFENLTVGEVAELGTY